MKIFLFLSLFLNTLYGDLIFDNYEVNNNIKILQEWDIDNDFFMDKDLVKKYESYVKNYKHYTYKSNRGNLFIPQIKKMLQDNGIPTSFIFLMMAESNFIVGAASHKKAIGLWQFMLDTGKRYGLQHNYYIDERLDIVKSTQAAIDYFKGLYKIFGKWYLVAFAYNCGEARVIEAYIRASLDKYCKTHQCNKDKYIINARHKIAQYQYKKAGFRILRKVYKFTKTLDYELTIQDFLKVQKNYQRQYLPYESRDYMRKIIALAMMFNEKFIINRKNRYLLNRSIYNSLIPVKVKGGASLKDIAKLIDMNVKDLTSVNQHILRGILPPDYITYDIYIPYEKLSIFKKNIKLLKGSTIKVHVVKKGDTLHKIAKKYNTSIKIIQKLNKLKSNFLHSNQKLMIPVATGMTIEEKNHEKI